MLGNAIGLVAGGAAFVAVAISVAVLGLDQDDGGRQPVFGLVLGGSFGLALGAAQARVLRDRIRRPSAWLVATAVGVAASATLIFGALDDGSGLPADLQTTLHPIAMGLIAGALQARVLRGEIQRAWRWVLVSLAAWGAGTLVSLGVPVDGLNMLVLAMTALVLEGAALTLLAPLEEPFALPD